MYLKPTLFSAVLFVLCSCTSRVDSSIELNEKESSSEVLDNSTEPNQFEELEELNFLAPSDDALYEEYCNARFGFCMLVPTSFKMDPKPQNGDGAVFRSKDKLTEIVLSGSIDNLETNLDDYYKWAQERINVSYKTKKSNFFVISGLREMGSQTMIVYTKTVFTKDIDGNAIYLTYQITYPSTQKQRFDGYCKLINQRLTP